MTNRNPNDSNPTWSIVLQYVACYLSWFITSVVAFWIIFLLRTNLIEDILFLRVNPWQIQAIDRFFIFGSGALWLVAVILTEAYLRNAIEQRKLGMRIGKIFVLEALLIALSFGIHLLSNVHNT